MLMQTTDNLFKVEQIQGKTENISPKNNHQRSDFYRSVSRNLFVFQKAASILTEEISRASYHHENSVSSFLRKTDFSKGERGSRFLK